MHKTIVLPLNKQQSTSTSMIVQPTISFPIIDLTNSKNEPFVFTKMPVALYQKIISELLKKNENSAQPTSTQALVKSIHFTKNYEIAPYAKKSSTRKGQRGTWTESEDRQLLELVKEFGPRKWSLIAEKLNSGRTGKQCRERYLNSLAPDINKNAWTPEEDAIIMSMHESCGNQWSKISKMLKGRTPNAIKNRWNSTLKRKCGIKRTYNCVEEVTDHYPKRLKLH